jgi:hypothetical protein
LAKDSFTVAASAAAKFRAIFFDRFDEIFLATVDPLGRPLFFRGFHLMDTALVISLSAACVSTAVGFVEEDTLESAILVLYTARHSISCDQFSVRSFEII